MAYNEQYMAYNEQYNNVHLIGPYLDGPNSADFDATIRVGQLGPTNSNTQIFECQVIRKFSYSNFESIQHIDIIYLKPCVSISGQQTSIVKTRVLHK